MWILPSRARPANVKRFFAAWRDTEASTPGVLWLDEDDKSHYYLRDLPHNWQAIRGPRAPCLADTQNALFRRFHDALWFGLIADDVVPLTRHWDSKLVATAGSWGISYASDGINNEKQFTHGVIGGELAREMGYLILPGLHRLYGDNVWTEIGRRRGVLRYRPDVLVEHWHFSNGKAQYDETYAKGDSNGDEEVFKRWLATYDHAPEPVY